MNVRFGVNLTLGNKCIKIKIKNEEMEVNTSSRNVFQILTAPVVILI